MESIYGQHRPELEKVLQQMLGRIDDLRKNIREKTGEDPIEHCLGRIKSEDSMREKCRRKGLPETTESALQEIHDAIGIRSCARSAAMSTRYGTIWPVLTM